MDNLTSIDKVSSLEQAWQGIKKAKPGIRIREAAIELGVSEAELLATTTGTEAVRLAGNWPSFLKRLPELGRVMSLTRNGSCILEHKGSFQKVNTFGSEEHTMGTVIGPIETRVFFKSWHVAFAVQQKKEDRVLTSLQVFDHEGHAVTKIYLQDESDWDAFEKLAQDYASEDQSTVQLVHQQVPDKFSDSVDTKSFLDDWKALEDTHDFFPMLKKHNVQRFHAVELAENTFSHRIEMDSIKQILDHASAGKLPVMIFAGNRGNLQIHQGKVRTIRLLERGHGGVENWLNVLDPDFNMHLRMDSLSSAWVVTKPTKDGDVTSVEVFDKNNELVVQFFGLRKPGIKELSGWKNLVDALPRLK